MNPSFGGIEIAQSVCAVGALVLAYVARNKFSKPSIVVLLGIALNGAVGVASRFLPAHLAFALSTAILVVVVGTFLVVYVQAQRAKRPAP